MLDRWCDAKKDDEGSKHCWIYTEKPDGRAEVKREMAEIIRKHYVLEATTKKILQSLGYKGLKETLRLKLPDDERVQAGEAGEILAVEMVKEELGYTVPIRKLCHKDGRNVPMRGDDFIAVSRNEQNKQFYFLKGEAKSRKILDSRTLQQARESLDAFAGRCNPHSLFFIADRMDFPEDEIQDAIIKEALQQTSGPSLTHHMIFTLSGNQPFGAIKTNLKGAKADREQYIVNFYIPDYSDFISGLYSSALDD